MALYYLDKEHFGLWSLTLQINGILALIDCGMNSAISRFITDHKDAVDDGEYGSTLLTGIIVFCIQGALIAIIGITCSWFAPDLLELPTHLRSEFRILLIILSTTTGGSVALRSIGSPLWAFQRSDILNTCSTIALLTQIVCLWIGFMAGLGVISFAIAPILPLICTLIIYGWFCHRNGYYPSKGNWGKPCFRLFKKTFRFGIDTMLIMLGSQMVNASQIIIISRWVGLEAAATFSIATKFYTMSMRFVNHTISASSPALAELFVRGERKRFISRYWDMIAIILLIATVAGASLAAGNRSVVYIWTNGSIQWAWQNDLLLGLLIVFKSINDFLIGLFGLIKDWQPVRIIPISEGLFFVPLAILGAMYFGISGVLFASLVSHLLIAGTFSAKAASGVIGSILRVRKALLISLFYILSGSAVGWISLTASFNPYITIIVTGITAAIITTLGWMWILPDHLRIELTSRLANTSKNISRIIGRSTS